MLTIDETDMKKERKHIVCFHLYNDFSGSPKVLKMVLDILLKGGHRVDLITSRGGILDTIEESDLLRRHSYNYHFSSRQIVTMARYALIQIYTFFMSLKWMPGRDVVFYINTILPVGAALAGKMMGKRVVYHYHENARSKGRVYRILAWMMERLADEIICVSAYQASHLRRQNKVTVIPNTLPAEYVEDLTQIGGSTFDHQRVMMLTSLREYKGIGEFVELSKRMPEYDFALVINDTEEEISRYFKSHKIDGDRQSNLTIYPRQRDVVRFYREASIVINLTDKNRAIETFGLTMLEAMYAGLPVIVPTEGGIAELVEDGVSGYKIDVQDPAQIEAKIRLMLSDREKYEDMSRKSRQRAYRYDAGNMAKDIERIFRE